MTDSDAYTGKAKGGKARSDSLSSEQRSEIAKKAAAARWETVQDAVCGSADRPLKIGDVEIECYVLEDGTRVITQASFLEAMGRSPRARRTSTDEGLPPIIQGKALRPFLPEGLAERAQPVPFRLPGGNKANGYRAELLPDVCEAFLAARDAGVLPKNQLPIAEAAALLVRGLARVGIIALVDEATGYQDMRTKDALAKILEEFVASELQAYLTTFPTDFYKEMFRLRGLSWSPEFGGKRPQYFGKLTNNIVYSRLAPGVLIELKRLQERTPAGNPRHKLFQRLTSDQGYPKLREHLGSVVTLMKLSDDWDGFMGKLERIHPKYGDPTLFDLPNDDH